MCPSGLPLVSTVQARPSPSMPRNACGARAATMASIAIWMLPSVLFLKPTGIDSPLAIWRWVWLSVVRAPIAVHAIRSARYCGTIGSRNSVAVGSPSSPTSISSSRARRSPPAMSNEPLRSGS